MARIPVKDELFHAIENQKIVEHDRPYLGMSSIGHACDRYLFYAFHWAFENYTFAQQKRLLNRGHLEEDVVLQDLKRVGIEVSFQQFEIADDTGHFRGHIDGLIREIKFLDLRKRILLEVKTMNDKNFKQYKKLKLQASNPGYYAQINHYMHHIKAEICLFIVTNKNNEERAYDWYEYDDQNYRDHARRARNILMFDKVPEKIGGPTWFICKMCRAKSVCHFDAPLKQHCRTCQHVEIHNAGQWKCSFHNEWLTIQKQRVGCEHWSRSEAFDNV